jgi:hypothetical protein
MNMDNIKFMEGKDKFLQVYSNLPIDVRREIILIIDEKPITWDVAFQEIDRETELGKRILKKAIEMELI